MDHSVRKILAALMLQGFLLSGLHSFFFQFLSASNSALLTSLFLSTTERWS